MNIESSRIEPTLGEYKEISQQSDKYDWDDDAADHKTPVGIYILATLFGIGGIGTIVYYLVIRYSLSQMGGVNDLFTARVLYGLLFTAILYSATCILLLIQNRIGWFSAIAAFAYDATISILGVMELYRMGLDPFSFDSPYQMVVFKLVARMVVALLLLLYLNKKTVVQHYKVKRWQGVLSFVAFMGLFLLYSIYFTTL